MIEIIEASQGIGVFVMLTKEENLGKAKYAIESGAPFFRKAAEHIAAAQEQGATQREIADALGKSAAWVNGLLAWRKRGYEDGTPFGPQSKASRKAAAQRVHSPKQKTATTSEQAHAATARARAETARAEAAKAKADAQRAKAEAAKAKADAKKARADENAKIYDFFRPGTVGQTGNNKIQSDARNKLVKLLGMLGSDYPGERANAAVMVEKHRVAIGMTWDDLIVSATVAQARAA